MEDRKRKKKDGKRKRKFGKNQGRWKEKEGRGIENKFKSLTKKMRGEMLKKIGRWEIDRISIKKKIKPRDWKIDKKKND